MRNRIPNYMCEECQGTGEIEHRNFLSIDEIGHFYLCTKCKGKGFVKENKRKCSKCGGSNLYYIHQDVFCNDCDKAKTGRSRLDWPRTALKLAFCIADCRSQDPYLQVGACGIKKNKDIVLGYNGPPSGVEVDWSDRDARRAYMKHAECNLLDKVKPGELDLLAITHFPCEKCMIKIKHYQVEKVYYCFGEWKNYDFKLSKRMAGEFGIELIQLKEI